jgi:Flp pilus assembly protein CpaB
MRLSRWSRFRRHPVGFWLITLALAGLTAATVFHAQARADAVVARWGRSSSVVVATRSVPLGGEVRAGDVRVVRMPRSLMPPGAVRSLSAAVGRWALAELSTGEVVLRRRLAPDGVRGLAALVPEGWRAVAVPMDQAGVRVDVGDVVDVLATFDTVEPAAPVVSGALVVDVREDAVTVAAPFDATTRLAAALTHGTVTLALRRPLGGSASGGEAEPPTER